MSSKWLWFYLRSYKATIDYFPHPGKSGLQPIYRIISKAAFLNILCLQLQQSHEKKFFKFSYTLVNYTDPGSDTYFLRQYYSAKRRAKRFRTACIDIRRAPGFNAQFYGKENNAYVQ